MQKKIHWISLPEFDPSVTLFPSGEAGGFAKNPCKITNWGRLLQGGSCKSWDLLKNIKTCIK